MELCGDALISSRGDTGRRSTVLTRASGARDGVRVFDEFFGAGDIADASGCTGNVRRILGCRRAVSGFGNGNGAADPALVVLALEMARSLRVVAVETGLDIDAAGSVGHSQEGYGGGGRTSDALGSSLLGRLVERYEVIKGMRGRSSWSGSNLLVSNAWDTRTHL